MRLAVVGQLRRRNRVVVAGKPLEQAAGPVAAARDMVLRWRGPDRLAADLDWLYGWEP